MRSRYDAIVVGAGSAGSVVAARLASDPGRQVLQNAFLDACSAAGFDVVPDHNAPDAVSAGITPKNQAGNRRVNAALAYLAPLVGRPNLTVAGGREVRSVLVERGVAVGVRLGSGEEVRGDEIVVAAGSYATPKLLLLSGIGPAHHLEAVGVRSSPTCPAWGRTCSSTRRSRWCCRPGRRTATAGCRRCPRP